MNELAQRVKLYGKYTTLDLYDLFQLMLKYPDIYIVTDSKSGVYEEVVKEFSMISVALKDYTKSEQKHIMNHCIVQLYNNEMLDAVESVLHFNHYIYTLYQRGAADLDLLSEFCVENNIPVVTMPYSWWTEEIGEMLHKTGLKVFLHTLNDIEEVRGYFISGADGIYTDFIIPSDEVEKLGK